VRALPFPTAHGGNACCDDYLATKVELNSVNGSAVMKSRLYYLMLFLAGLTFFRASLLRASTNHDIKIGNYFVSAPYGITIIVDDATAFVLDPDCDEEKMKSRYSDSDPALTPPGVSAPDFTFSQVSCHHDGATIRFTWGRSGKAAVLGMLETDRKVSMTFRLPGTTWPHFHAAYAATGDALTGYGVEANGKFVPFVFQSNPAPALVRANMTFHAEIILHLDPQRPTRFVAGIGPLPALESVASTLATAGKRYASMRISAQGDWGDFLGAIADNLNNARLYASDNKRVAHAIGRGWWMRKDPDPSVFCLGLLFRRPSLKYRGSCKWQKYRARSIVVSDPRWPSAELLALGCGRRDLQYTPPFYAPDWIAGRLEDARAPSRCCVSRRRLPASGSVA
jgi:hypothetical protein